MSQNTEADARTDSTTTAIGVDVYNGMLGYDCGNEFEVIDAGEYTSRIRYTKDDKEIRVINNRFQMGDGLCVQLV